MMKNSLKHAFLDFVREHGLISHGQKILVAVSGGIDSMVLLNLLMNWRDYFDLRIGAAHYNHQLRGQQSCQDEQFVEKIARDWGLSFYKESSDVQMFARKNNYSLEEAGRILRENFLVKCKSDQGFDAIATGHNLNDHAETIFMRILSGTGLEGLAGIRLQRPGFIRPLLFAARPKIEEYAAQNNIEYREDASNTDLVFFRNKIRHRLLPFLKKEFNFSEFHSLLSMSLIVQEWLPQVGKEVEMLFEEGVVREDQNKIHLDIFMYRKYFSWIRIKALEKVLAQLLNRDVKLSYRKFNDFTKWVNKKTKGSIFKLNNQISVEKKKENLVFKKIPGSAKKIEVLISSGQSFKDDQLGLAISLEMVDKNSVLIGRDKLVEYLEASFISFPLQLRNWRAGDRMQPLGMPYQKKISDFLTDEKKLILPKEQMLVLENKDDIVCVIGSRISDKYKVSPNTSKILRLEVKLK